jgi:hypothetical protein
MASNVSEEHNAYTFMLKVKTSLKYSHNTSALKPEAVCSEAFSVRAWPRTQKV